jgi:hypothetical protein
VESRAHRLTPGLVFAAVFIFLASSVTTSDIAAPLVNAVDTIHAQDESVYASAATHMAREGNWLTPVFLDRFYLFKPLLTYVFAGVSVKLLGWSLFAVRLPTLLAASALAALLFVWARRSLPRSLNMFGGMWAAVSAVLLLVSNSLVYTLARLCYSDVLLLAFTVAALYSLARDPELKSPAAFWSFVVFDAAAILTKSLAGLIPLFILALFTLLSPQRPSARRLVQIALAVALLAAPWHLYQTIVHPKWFWTEYIDYQLFRFGLHPPVARGTDPVWFFYVRRIFLTDPFLCIAAAIALPSLVRWMLKRNPAALLAGCWLFVAATIVCTYQWRNFPYAAMLIVPLALIAAAYGPRWQMPVLVGVVLLKLFWPAPMWPTPMWSLHYAGSRPLAAARLLKDYAARARSNELILIDTDDEFYSATLDFRQVRYCFLDPGDVTLHYEPFFADLGITVTAAQFQALDPELFRDRLRAWGLDNTRAVATSIVAHTPEEIQHLIDTHPHTDFYAPTGYAGGVSHQVVAISATRSLLLAAIQ